MTFLYMDRLRDVERWQKQIKQNIKKIRINPMDEQEQEFIDLDVVLKLYVEEYKGLRLKLQK